MDGGPAEPIYEFKQMATRVQLGWSGPGQTIDESSLVIN